MYFWYDIRGLLMHQVVDVIWQKEALVQVFRVYQSYSSTCMLTYGSSTAYKLVNHSVTYNDHLIIILIRTYGHNGYP